MGKFWKWLQGEKGKEETASENDSEVVSSPPEPPPSFVQIERDVCLPVQEKYQSLSDKQMLLGQLLLNFEEQKQQILKDMDDLRDQIEREVDALKEQHGVPLDDDNYSLNLPRGEKGKGAFIRDFHGKNDPNDAVSVAKGETALEVGNPSE